MINVTIKRKTPQNGSSWENGCFLGVGWRAENENPLERILRPLSLNPAKCGYLHKARLGGVPSGCRGHLPHPLSSAPGLVIMVCHLVTGYIVGVLLPMGIRFLLQSSDQPRYGHLPRRADYKCGNELRCLVSSLLPVCKRSCRAVTSWPVSHS